MIKSFAVAASGAAALSLWSGSASAGCTLGTLAELPVTMSGAQPMVQAKINGEDAAFVADSGAFYSLITPASAAEHHLRLGPAPYGMTINGVGGSVQDISLATVKSFAFAGFTIPNVEFFVAGGEVGSGAAGVLGQNVFKIGDVEYDLANGVIRLFQPKDCGAAPLAYWAKTAPFSVMDINWTTPLEPHTTGAAYLNGVRIKVMFDTGADRSSLSLRAAQRAGFKADGPGVVAAGFSRGVGRRLVKTWIAPFASFKIGDEEIKTTHLRVEEDTVPGADMLLGADFFLSHRVYVASSQHKLYFTYNGGPVFNLRASPGGESGDGGAGPAEAADKQAAAPADAAGFSRRGAAFAARRDFEHAIADFDKACDLAPTEPDYVYQRGLAHLNNRQPLMAMADFNRALSLKPDDLPALLARAEMRIGDRDKAEGVKDLDAADKAAAKEADARLRIAVDYMRAELFAPALSEFDLWIKAHPQDSRQALALTGRCWSRAQLGRELDQASADCNAAFRQAPNTEDALDSRGLVYLRLSRWDKAIADYNAALTLQPKNVWALYGRGVARIRTGLAAEGQADIAAAEALRPGLANDAKSRGIGP